MARTGESYTAARAALLAANGSGTRDHTPMLVTSDAAIRQRTGHGWEEWFGFLDEAGMAERPHREIARLVAARLGVAPLAWAPQAVTVSFERARGGRAVGQQPDGFTITASRTVHVPVERLFHAVVDQDARRLWLADGDLRERTSTRPRSARFDWGDGSTRVSVTFQAKGETAATVAVEHTRLVDSAAADEMKAWWRGRLATLKSQLEGGDSDA